MTTLFDNKEIVIFHNPRCSKSRATLELLRNQGKQPRVVEYLRQPPSAAELAEISSKLGLQPRALMRRQEAPYREQNLDDPALDESALLDALRAYPILLQRPIVVANGKAAIGRPPDAVLAIL